MLGTMTRDLILDFVEALSRRDGAALLDLVERMVEHTPDFSGVLAELLAVFHRLAVGQVVPRSLEAAAEPRMDALVDAMTPEDLQLYYQIGLVGRRDLDLAPDPRTGFEMVLLRMLAFRPDMEGEGGKPKPAPEYRPAPPSAVREPAPEPMVPPKQAAPPPVAAGPMQLANGEDWHALAAALPLHALSKQLADNCEFESWDGRVLQLRLDPGCSGIRVGAAEQKLIRALQGRLGEQVQVQIREASPRSETPAQREQRQRDERQRQAEVAVEGDPLVQALQETFDASLVPGSVRPINEN
jgi:DNA polymerase-3 subunit gamma/tau